MGVPMAVNVTQTVEQLLEVDAGLGLRKATTQRDKVKQLTTADQLQDDVVYHLLLSKGRVFLGALAHLHKLHNVLVDWNLGECLKLRIDLISCVFIVVKNLDCVASTVFDTLSEFDNTGPALSECPAEDVFFVEYNWHNFYLS